MRNQAMEDKVVDLQMHLKMSRDCTAELRAEIALLTAERDRLKSALTRLRHSWPTEEQTVWAYAGEVSDIAEEALQEAK